MEIKSAEIILFSPTGGTRKVISSFVRGMKLDNFQIVNLAEGLKPFKLSITSDIVIIGLPVYGKRIPQFLYPFLTNIDGNNKPVVLITLYGNISPGWAIDELYAITRKINLKVVAWGRFIGEHSFSTPILPVAEGRPNEDDLDEAQKFGKLTREKLMAADTIENVELKLLKPIIVGYIISLINKIVPQKSGNVFTKLPSVNMKLCQNCGICVRSCPKQAIDSNDLHIQRDLCIRCFSCVKKCPSKAREIKYKKKILVTWFFNRWGNNLKKPEYFL
ncbi:EFR1 family ferrodoxin [Desulfitobacterium sp. Sab5]|uniref:EFR1 family ferrodoxin n=1 Tax=Desulfitobacterium nosdiversum TaxID=3375356 RepID=UPI003CE78DED